MVREADVTQGAKASGCGVAALIIIVALGIGWFAAAENAQRPEIQAERSARAAERRAEELCRRAGCPENCRNAGMC